MHIIKGPANKYLVEAEGYFGRVFRYTVEASSKADAIVKGRLLLEKEFEWGSGNISRMNWGGMKVIKKLQER